MLLLSACAPAGGAVASGASETTLPATSAPSSTSTTTQVVTTTATAAPTPAGTDSSETPSTTVPPPLREIFAWMPAGLTPEFIDAVTAVPGVAASSVITTVTMHLTASHKADGTVVDQPLRGFVIPLHGAIVDPQGLQPIFRLPEIGPDQIILGEDSARLRRLEVGDTMTFETGATLIVGGIVDEDLMAGYEAIAVDPGHFVESRMQARAMLVLYDHNPNLLDLQIKPLVPDDLLYAVRERTDSADRGGLVVRSQVFIKENFGEFAYRPTGNGRFVIDPAWVEANIVETRIPLLGRTKCHRVMTDILTAIMRDLAASGLSEVIDRSAYAGCWNPRYIAGSYRLSRHSFGAAADINIFNPTDGGPGSPVHEELLSRTYAAGLTSGHVWTNADPGHFEYFGFADPE